MMARPASARAHRVDTCVGFEHSSMKPPRIHTMTPVAQTHQRPAMPSRLWILALQMAMALSAAGAMALPTIALGANTAPKSARQTATQPTKKKGSLKIKHQRSPSEETSAERDRRLTRECKGAPNAGACLGYTRK